MDFLNRFKGQAPGEKSAKHLHELAESMARKDFKRFGVALVDGVVRTHSGQKIGATLNRPVRGFRARVDQTGPFDWSDISNVLLLRLSGGRVGSTLGLLASLSKKPDTALVISPLVGPDETFPFHPDDRLHAEGLARRINTSGKLQK